MIQLETMMKRHNSDHLLLNSRDMEKEVALQQQALPLDDNCPHSPMRIIFDIVFQRKAHEPQTGGCLGCQ